MWFSRVRWLPVSQRWGLRSEDMLLDLYALDEAGLKGLMKTWGRPLASVATPRWLYTHGAQAADDMSGLPRGSAIESPQMPRLVPSTALQSKPARTAPPSVSTSSRWAADRDGADAVQRWPKDRVHLVPSGTAMGCVFCATGQMGFARHLTAGEIFGQAAAFSAELRREGQRLSNVVLMGMGEPFHNYDAVVEAIRRIIADLGIGARHITVSTVGLVPAIRRFAEEGLQVTLAISLHAATDEARGKLLPVNRRWPLADLMDACRHYGEVTRRRVTFSGR